MRINAAIMPVCHVPPTLFHDLAIMTELDRIVGRVVFLHITQIGKHGGRWYVLTSYRDGSGGGGGFCWKELYLPD